MADLRIEPLRSSFNTSITPPGSKSLTNRALVLAALGKSTCTLSNVLFADDTRVMFDGLQKLGFPLSIDEAAKTVIVNGAGGTVPAQTADLFCGNSGTTIRFLTAVCTLGHGAYTLDGVARMWQRPIGPLVNLLKNIGGRFDFLGEPGFPPLRVRADGLPGGIVRAEAALSSQYLSALLMVAPSTRNEVLIDLAPNQMSWPYVVMTMRLMDHFGVTPEVIRQRATGVPEHIHVPQGTYDATEYAIEPDASNASYFLALAAVHPGSSIRINGLGRHSLQGDVAFANVLGRMGARIQIGEEFLSIDGPEKLEAVDVDLSEMPDVAQTLAVVALFAEGPTTIHGLRTLRVKETDRIAALATEATKLGAEVEIRGDEALTIHPPDGGKLKVAAIDTYEDHRMAMSFAIAGTKSAGVTIRGIECVNKTYPGFFADLNQVTESNQP